MLYVSLGHYFVWFPSFSDAGYSVAHCGRVQKTRQGVKAKGH